MRVLALPLLVSLALMLPTGADAHVSATGATASQTCGSWTILPAPDGPAPWSTLQGVTAISGRDVWAVGYSYDAVAATLAPLIEHWDGSTWSIVPSPAVGIIGLTHGRPFM
jgi:hypothetical protein